MRCVFLQTCGHFARRLPLHINAARTRTRSRVNSCRIFLEKMRITTKTRKAQRNWLFDDFKIYGLACYRVFSIGEKIGNDDLDIVVAGNHLWF